MLWVMRGYNYKPEGDEEELREESEGEVGTMNLCAAGEVVGRGTQSH